MSGKTDANDLTNDNIGNESLHRRICFKQSSGKPEVRFNGSTAMLCQLRLVQFKLNLLTKLLRTELFCIIKMKITTFLDLLVALRYHNLAWSCSVHFNGDRISVIP